MLIIVIVVIAVLSVVGLGGWRLRAQRDAPIMQGSAIALLGLRPGETHGHVWDATAENIPVVVSLTSDQFLVWGPTQEVAHPQRLPLAALTVVNQHPATDSDTPGRSTVVVDDGGETTELVMTAVHASAFVAALAESQRSTKK